MGTWTAFDDKLPVLLREYSFGPATAHALAVGIEGGLAVVSPPFRAGPAGFDELLAYGQVKAIVAPNAYHNLGIREWHQRYPGAPLFAPAQSIARLARRTGLASFAPLAQLRTGADVEFVEMPHYKTGEALVKMNTVRGRAWYVTDVVFNYARVPGPLPARLLFRLSATAPGLRFNNIAGLFMIGDKAALKRWLAAEAARDPPRYLLPAHGDVAQLAAGGAALQGLFER